MASQPEVGSESYEEVEVTCSDEEMEEYEEIIEETEVESVQSPMKRPPHPLFGGGGPAKSALLDQIKARGSTPATSQGSGAGGSVAAKPRAAAPKPPPKLLPKPTGEMTLAEQVAAMAAKRSQRLGGEQNSPVVSSPPPAPAAPIPTRAPLPKAAPKKAEATKKGGFFGGTKKEATKKAPPKPVAQPPKPAPAPYTIKSYVPPPLPATNKAEPSSSFSQARLKPTGIREDRPAPPQPQPAQEEETAPAVPVTTTTRTTTTTKTKRVTKSNPQYDEVEYKLGCFCVVM